MAQALVGCAHWDAGGTAGVSHILFCLRPSRKTQVEKLFYVRFLLCPLTRSHAGHAPRRRLPRALAADDAKGTRHADDLGIDLGGHRHKPTSAWPRRWWGALTGAPAEPRLAGVTAHLPFMLTASGGLQAPRMLSISRGEPAGVAAWRGVAASWPLAGRARGCWPRPKNKLSLVRSRAFAAAVSLPPHARPARRTRP
jgi:hypothetical protein